MRRAAWMWVFVLLAAAAGPARAGSSIGAGPGVAVVDTTSRYLRAAQGRDVPARGAEQGVLLGTPAGLDVALGYWLDRWCVRASGGGASREIWGAQAAFVRCVGANPRRHAVGLVAGRSVLRDREWSYGGAVYQLRGRWWLLETGVSAGHGKGFSSPQLLAQLGLNYR